MIEVRLLGQQSVTADGREILAVSAQPKRLALLVYLVLAGTRGDGFVSRDQILALFWPESDQRRSRNTLNQHLFHLRESLGHEAIQSRGASRLGVDGARVWCDAVEFGIATNAGDAVRALSLYEGELLSGFYLSGAREFEEWLDNQRLDHRRNAFEAALVLADEADRASDLTEAVRWYRCAMKIEPESASVRRRLDAAIARVNLAAGQQAPEPIEPTPPEPGAGTGGAAERRAGRPARPRFATGFGMRAGLLAVGVAVVALIVGSRAQRQLPRSELRRVAVLPFEAIGGDAAAHLGAALHDDLIRQLQHVSALTVIARQSVLAYRNTELTLTDIARELDVDAIVQASVFGNDSLVRIGVSLHVWVPNEQRLWGREYREEVHNVLNLDRTVVRDIAEAVEATLTPEENTRFAREQRVDPEAFAAYSLGIHLWNRFNPRDLERAIAYLEAAISLEPTNALYHAGLAQALLVAGSPHGSLTPEEAWPQAKEAALRAVQLDQWLADGYAALGWVLNFHDNSSGEAHRAFRRAIALNPSSALAHWGLAELLGREFRPEEALTELRLAQRLDPLTPIYSGDVAVQLYFLRRYDEAIVEAERSVELDPNFAPSLWILGEAYLAKGRSDEAVAAHERAASISPAFNVFLVHTYVAVGRRADAEDVFRESRDSWDKNGPYALGAAYAALGETDSALAWLRAAYESGDPYVYTIKFMPHFEGLRDTPGFARLVAELDSVAGAAPR